jgi:shikimate kinase
MMGVGKSTVGTITATILGWQFLDSDQQVLDATGRTVKEIFDSDGEEVLHTFESDAMRAAVTSDASVVAAVAGGVVLGSANRALLRNGGTIVWLRASLETLSLRVGEKGDRPHFDGDPTYELANLYEVRQPLYESLADIVVDVDDRGPDEIAQFIVNALGRRHGSVA